MSDNENGNDDGAENDSLLPYDQWVEESLRMVIYRALDHASQHGLPGNHHYYITFRTHHPDTHIPDSLRAQHPDTMTIVLQYQFERLNVSADGFDVTLHFGGRPETLAVPFAAVTSFHDPAVNFGLQLNAKGSDETAENESDDEDGIDNETAAFSTAPGAPDAPSDAKKDQGKTGEVIALDQFRKK